MIIISMDSHTELVANLKPFLPHKWHGEFDEGEVLARRYFSKVIDSFGRFVAAGNNLSEVGFTALPDSGRPLAIEEYVRPTSDQRTPGHDRCRRCGGRIHYAIYRCF